MIGLTRWPKVEDLRAKLNGKAKARPKYRFYSLYDKVYRKDFLEASFAQCRANDGAPGVDGKSFADIEAYGVDRYLEELADELKRRRYQPAAVRRVMIEKEDQPGQYRPLGIPTIRDRVVQQVVKLLLESIFETDFTDNAYGYRAGRSAQDAVKDVDRGLRERYVNVVDGDLSKYFDTIPHEALMQSVERRIADRKVLGLIRSWLKVPVQETTASGKTVISGGKKTKAGTPQGGVISPLLANIYFRRFLIAWRAFGYERKYEARIVNYADDFVILCRKPAHAAYEAARDLLTRLGLKLNVKKTRVVRAWQTSFDFLGYTFGVMHTRNGRECLGKRPSKKNVQRYREGVRQLTGRSQTWKDAATVAKALNGQTQGFWAYFNLGATNKERGTLDRYLGKRMYIWAKSKYTTPRRKKRHSSGPADRWRKIRAALALVRPSKDLKPWRGGELFASAASYAQ